MGEVLTHIDVNPENDEILLTTESGRRVRIYHEQDCCESVHIQDTEGDWNTLVGKPIVEATQVEDNATGPGEFGSSTLTTLTFKVDGATVISRWIGDSNGYYSESVDIKEITRPVRSG